MSAFANPITVQRVENLAIAAFVMTAVVVSGESWWWLVLTFLLFDVSMVGYLAGPRIGAALYNAVHNYTVPAVLALAGFAIDERWWWILVAAWSFHVAVDRAVGYGLKTDEGFTHTHLGRIGKDAPTA